MDFLRKLFGQKQAMKSSSGNTSQALDEISDAGTIETLITALKHRNWDACKKGANALQEIKDPRAIGPLIMVVRLTDSDDDGFTDYHNIARQSAQAALGNIGVPAINPLSTALTDRDKVVRWVAADVLGEIGDPRAVKPLITALNDNHWKVRQSAQYALGKIKDARAVGPLIEALIKDNSSNGAAWALAEIGDKRAIKPLEIAAENLRNVSEQQRQFMLNMLAKICR